MSSKDTVALELARPQIRPVSWAGNEPFLTAPPSITVATISRIGVSDSSRAWRSEKSRQTVYTRSMRSCAASRKRPIREGLSGSACALRKRLHSAGVSVSETIIDTTIAATRVMVNSRKNAPTMPLANSSGMNTATSEAVMETMVKPISRAPVSAACMRGMPSSRWRMTFSITTIASSTTNPIAITSASRLRLFRVKPNTYITSAAPASDNGTVTAAIRVGASRRRNSAMVRITIARLISRVICTSCSDERMVGVRSKYGVITVPGCR